MRTRFGAVAAVAAMVAAAPAALAHQGNPRYLSHLNDGLLVALCLLVFALRRRRPPGGPSVEAW